MVSGSSSSATSANPIGTSAGTILLGDTTSSASAPVFGASTSATYSTGTANSPTAGAFGTGIAMLDGGSIRSNTVNDSTIHNTLNLSGTITGVTVATEKSLIFTGTGKLTGNTTFASAIGSTVSGSSITFSGNIGDGGNGYGITKSAAGTLLLSGTNTYSGLTTVSGGELRITNAGCHRWSQCHGGISIRGGYDYPLEDLREGSTAYYAECRKCHFRGAAGRREALRG